MKRDWDKLKRHDKARSDYDPIASFRPFKPRKRRFKPHRKFIPKQAKKPSVGPDFERVLTLFPDSPTPTLSRWRRTKGLWKCLSADAPYEWFTRASIEAVESWIHKQRFPYKWQPATPVCRAHNPHTEDNTAEAYPPNQASALSRDNTVASLNNPSPEPVCARCAATAPGLEQDGVPMSSLLNGYDCLVEPETRANRS